MATATRIPDPAPRSRSLTREEWNQRAKELYQARTVLYGWHRMPMAARPGVEVFAVLSGEQHQTYAGPRHLVTREHIVRYIQATGEVRCDCQAGTFGRSCAHAGQVLFIKEQDARACGTAAA